MKSKTPEELKDGHHCTVTGGTHKGKSGHCAGYQYQ